MPIAIGDRVKLKAVQESEYLPQSLRDYLDTHDLSREDAVFTVSRIFDGTRDTMVEFVEFDTIGGYYLRRFELADTTLADWERELTGPSDAHQADIAAIGARLIEEANQRGWCSVFDRAVEDLNQTLTVKLPVRDRWFTVTLDGVGSFNVKADSQEAANEKAITAARAAIDALG